MTRRWLTDHVSGLEAPYRYANSVLIWERFYEHLRSLGRMPEPYTVARIKPAFVRELIKYREDAGISAPSISRDLKALRGPINWAMREGIYQQRRSCPT
jgi:site-specific recombinase XerD